VRASITASFVLRILREAPDGGKGLTWPKSVWPFFLADSVIPTEET
jgi:hypothetical protein